MAHTLRPYRDYSEHDVVNLFAFDGAQDANGVIATAGTVVKVAGNGFQPVADSTLGGGTGFLGAIPVDLGGTLSIPGLSNVVSNRYVLTAKVQAANSGLFIKFFTISAAVAEFITSPFLFTLLTTQASKAIGRRSMFLDVSTSGKNFFRLAIEARDRYLSFSSLTTGLI